MKRAGILVAVLVVLAATFTLASGGHPVRIAVGMFAGAEALSYLPPRRQVASTAGPPQPTLSLAEAGIDPQSVALAAQYAGARNTTALVIGLNGHVVHQQFWNGGSLQTPLEASAFSPVLSALVLGTALQNGELRDLDAQVGRYLVEWAGDPRGTITFRDLLTGNSNLAAPGERTWPVSLAARYHSGADLEAALLAWPQADHPDPAGSSPAVDADVLALVLSRALGADYASLLRERLWQPLGGGELSLSATGRGGAGMPRAGCCLRASAGDWLRVGMLIANHGIFEGSQLAPPDFARLLVAPRPGSARAVFVRTDGRFAARDLVWLEASGRQRLWMVPSLKLVILRAGGEPGAGEGWDEAMIPDSIIRGTRGWQPASPGADGKVDPNRYAPHR